MSDANAQDAFELSVSRHIAAPPDRVWQIMTERLPEWFCPKPWRVEVVEQDWRAGGRTSVVMHGPNGERSPGDGVFLEVTPGKRFVFTDAFLAGWKPRGPFMVGIFEIAPDGEGTRFTASARHWSKESFEQHKSMGFEAGWSTVAAQLAALAEAD